MSITRMSPTVIVQKKTGEICLCVDYRELNKKTTCDASPLPLQLPDEVQDWLAGYLILKWILAAPSKSSR